MNLSVVAIAAGAYGSSRDPALASARKIGSDADEEERICARRRDIPDVSGKLGVATRTERHGGRSEDCLRVSAGIAHQRAFHLINWSRRAGGIPTIQYEPFDIEGNTSGRKIDASPSAGRAPRSGPGVDSRDRIVIGNGDIADDCLPANAIIVVVLRERSYGKQQNCEETYYRCLGMVA